MNLDNKKISMEDLTFYGGMDYVSGKDENNISEYFLCNNGKPRYVLINDYRGIGSKSNLYLFKYNEYDNFDKIKQKIIQG